MEIIQQLIQTSPFLFATIVVGIMILKGIALWKAVELKQKGWFIAILIINTLGILEVIYILFVSKKKEKEQNN